jgi:hypothetical protein
MPTNLILCCWLSESRTVTVSPSATPTTRPFRVLRARGDLVSLWEDSEGFGRCQLCGSQVEYVRKSRGRAKRSIGSFYPIRSCRYNFASIEVVLKVDLNQKFCHNYQCVGRDAIVRGDGAGVRSIA